MKKKTLLTSLLTIAMCLALIAGSTYALFTSEDEINIAVTSGKVKVTATVGNLKTSSLEIDQPTGKFANGGTAVINETAHELVLTNVTPGDKATFDITVKNDSTVTILYRTIVWMVSDDGLWSALDVSINNVEYNGKTKATEWEVVAPGGNDFVIPVSIELPAEVEGEQYMGKTCKIAYAVEALQGNAYPENEDGSHSEEDIFYVYNDGGLAAALEDIKANSKYWNKEIKIVLAPNTYSSNHTINQYPEWNGNVGAGNTANNMTGVDANTNYTNITFVGAEGVKFTGNVIVNGWGNAGSGFTGAQAKTTFQNIVFDAANSADEADVEDAVVMYVKAAANNVNFDSCTFKNATHVTLGGSGADGVGLVNFNNCKFNNGGCLSGYVETLNVTNSNVNGADNGFINKSKAGVATVENCVIKAGKYFLRTSNSGVELVVTDSEITMYESAEGKKDLVNFRGSDESATFTDCDIATGYTTAGVDANSTLEIGNYENIDGVTYYLDGVTGENTLYLVPADFAGDTVVVTEGTTAIGNYAFAYNTNVKTVVLASTVRDLGRGFDSSSVEKVVLNEGLEVISSRAFRSTTALKEVVISSTVKVIADNAFQKSALKTITIPATVETIGETAFGASKIETVIFEGNTTIQGFAFRGCTELRTVYLNGDYNNGADKVCVPSTLNGRNSTWFCNGESNNPNTSNITFYVKNAGVKEQILTAMGAEKNNTKIVFEQKVTSTEELVENLATAAPGTIIDATGVKTTVADIATSTGGRYNTINLSAGITIKGLTLDFSAANDNFLLQDSAEGGEIVFDNCTFTSPDFSGTAYFQNDANTQNTKVVFNNCTFASAKVIVACSYYPKYGEFEFNNCTFNLNNDGYGLVQCMGGNSVFNKCEFNISGSGSMGSSSITKYGHINLYSERSHTEVTLNQCTGVPAFHKYTYQGTANHTVNH